MGLSGVVRPTSEQISAEVDRTTPNPSFAKEGNGFTRTVLRTLLSVGFIIAVLMWQQSGQWVPTGDRARDSAVKPRSDFMIFYGAAMVMRHSPEHLYDQQKEGAAQSAATGLDISAADFD